MRRTSDKRTRKTYVPVEDGLQIIKNIHCNKNTHIHFDVLTNVYSTVQKKMEKSWC